MMFEGCFVCVFRLFKSVSRVFHGFFKSVSGLSQGYFMAFSRLFKECFKGDFKDLSKMLFRVFCCMYISRMTRLARAMECWIHLIP